MVLCAHKNRNNENLKHRIWKEQEKKPSSFALQTLQILLEEDDQHKIENKMSNKKFFDKWQILLTSTIQSDLVSLKVRWQTEKCDW